MAEKAPKSIEVTDFQFKIHKKHQVFNQIGDARSDINLLATASNYGIIFVGDPNTPELKVILLENLVETKEKDADLLVRQVQLPSIPHCLAASCDGSLLAVNYTLNGSAFISIYNVPAFLSGYVLSKLSVRVSPEDNVQILQILWNPVIPNTLAIVLNNGSLGMYNLKESGFEFSSIDRQEKVKCACWSPKGKQIVLGYPGGRLVQYKPDLKVARTIACPDNVHGGPFDTVAVQWLSNYQFAAVFLQEGEDITPALYIINAPKTGNPSYINYSDISYSQCGPRNFQIFLIHIQAWNILLMTTSNSMEAGMLGTHETGDNPTWTQYTLALDEARLELPLTIDKQDSFPIGFALETGCTHQLTIAENKIPVMPMIHVLSTHGLFISFDFLNLTPNAPGICSPPQPIADMSGLNLFQPISELLQIKTSSSDPTRPSTTQTGDLSFAVPSGATSTPSVDRKLKSVFGDKPAGAAFNSFSSTPSSVIMPPPATNVISAPLALSKTTASPSGFFQPQATQNPSIVSISQPNAALPFQSQISKTGITFGITPTTGNNSNSVNVSNSGMITGHAFTQSKSTIFDNSSGKPLVQNEEGLEVVKPLYTIPPTYTGNSQNQYKPSLQETKIDENKISSPTMPADSDVHDIIKELIKTQIESFELELKELSSRSKDINISIGCIEESKTCTKRLNDLQELNDRAVEIDMESDIQILRHSLSESFAMIAEVKSKLNVYKNPELSELAASTPLNQTNRRQMAKLKSLVATNEAQLQIVQHKMDAQWANYQDLVRQNARTKMHIPGLEGIYQTLTKQKDILARQRIKINFIKSKLGVKGLINKSSDNKDVTVDSLVDSILSMSLADQVKIESLRLTNRKLNAVRDTLKGRNIIKIKPQRPRRIGLNSEVILETKIRTVPTSQREGAATKPEKMEKLRIQSDKIVIAKPTATKGLANISPEGLSVQQVKKVEPKQQPVQMIPQKPVPKALSAFNSSEGFANQQQIKPFGIFSQPPTSFIGNSFGKAAEFSLTSTPSTTSGIFGGNQPLSSTTNVSSTQRVEINKPTGAISTFGENKTLQSFSDAKTVENPKSGNGALSFRFMSEKFEIPKEPTAIPFSPKVIGGERANFGFTFSSKLSDAVDQKSVSDVNTEVDTKFETKTDQSSPFPSVTLAVRSEAISTTTTPSSFLNLTIRPTGVLNSNTGGSDTPAVTVTTTTSALPSGFANLPVTPNTTFSFEKATENINISPSELIKKNDNSNLSAALPESSSSQNLFGLLSMSPQLTISSIETTSTTTPTTSTTPPATSTTALLSSAGTLTTFSFATTSLPSLASTTVSSPTQSTEAPAALTTKSDITAENILEDLSICQPTALEDAIPKSSSSIFGGSPFGSSSFTAASSADDAKSIFGTSTSSPSLFNIAASSKSPPLVVTSVTPSVTSFPKTIVVTACTFGTTSTTSTTPAFSAAATTWGFGPPNVTSTATTSAFSSLPTTTAIFAGTPTTSAPQFEELKTTTSFSGVSSSAPVYGTTVTTTATSAFGETTAGMPTPLFGTTTASSSSSPAFGTVATSPSFTNVSGTTSTSIFGGIPSPTSSGNIFGGIPKPDQSVFAPTTSEGISLFTNNNAGTSLFHSPTTNQQMSGDNIFGTTAQTGFGTQPVTSTGSIFGGSAPVSQASMPFATSSEAATNVFASPPQGNQGSGGSIFGSSFNAGGQTSIFGGGGNTGFFGQTPSSSFAATGNQQNSQFGGPPSVFAQNSFASPSPFSSQTVQFGSTSPGGSFAQGGASVAQTGFGSPGGSFTKTAFSSPPFGGSPPGFGGAPIFGGVSSFGTPKTTFGAFGGNNTDAFSTTAQKNALFETLGASDTGLSFGNLAQSSNTPTTKPHFGGSQFSTWR